MEFVFSALAGGALLAALIRLAPRLGLMDRPGGHKRHATPVPAVGGLAVYAAVALVWLAGGVSAQGVLALAGAGLLVAVGALDDRRGLRARWRLLAQAAAIGTMLAAGEHIHTLGNLFGFGEVGLPGMARAAFTATCALAMINALNMVDGLDGQAGGLALIALAYLAFGAWWSGDGEALRMIAGIAGALAVFLALNARHPWNPRARVFLGDAGSTALGFWLVWFAVDLAQPGADAPRALAPVTVVWVLAVPLFEVMTSTVRRLAARRNPLAPDCAHVHHLLLAGGLRPGQAMALRWALGALFGAIGVFGWLSGMPEPVLSFGFAGAWLVHYGLVRYWRRAFGESGTRAVAPAPASQ